MLVDFWATGAVPALLNLRIFRTLSVMYSDRDLSLVTVSVNMPDEQASVLRFLQEETRHQPQSALLLDGYCRTATGIRSCMGLRCPVYHSPVT